MKNTLPNIFTKCLLGIGISLLSINTPSKAQTWQQVGPSVAVSSGGSSYNNLVIDTSGNYYISYYDVDAMKGSVQQFNGTDWSYVGGAAGITTDIALFNSLSINSEGHLYYTNQISWPGAGMEVRYFNGTSWTSLINPVSSGINYHASAVNSEDVVYVFSGESSGTVKKYVDGAWVQVGVSGFSSSASFAEMLIDADNNVYVSIANGSSINVYTISGDASSTETWTHVGGSAVGTASSGEQYTADIAIDAAGVVYVAYVANAAMERKINVKKLNDGIWEQVGSANFSEEPVQHLALAVSNDGIPYVVASRWADDDFLKNKAYAFNPSTNTWNAMGEGFISDGEAKYNDIRVDEIGNYLVLVYSGEDATEVKRFSLDGTVDPPLPIVDSVVVHTAGDVPAIINTMGGNLSLEAIVYPLTTDQTVTWSVVSGEAFASLSTSGLVTAIADGIITIRATSVVDDTQYDDIAITISNQSIAITNVMVTTVGGTEAAINTLGGTLSLVSSILPSTANQDVTWSISAGESIATVSASGVVTALNNGTVTIRATSVEDASKFGEINVVITNQHTSSIEIVDNKNFTVYPNPAKDVLMIDTDQSISTVSIYNVLGQKMIASTQSTINVSTLPIGMYIVEIISIENTKAIIKFEKK